MGQVQHGRRKLIEGVTASCRYCQKYSSKPFRFRASIYSENIVYNHELVFYLVYLNRWPAQQAVDTNKNFQTAVFVSEKSTEGL